MRNKSLFLCWFIWLASVPLYAQTANLWIDTDGGTCTRSASLIAYNTTTACATINAAITAATAGDTVIMKSGSTGGYAGSQTISAAKSSPGVLVKCENPNWDAPFVPSATKDSCVIGSGNGSLSTSGSWYTLQDISYKPGDSRNPTWINRCATDCTFRNFDVDGAFVGIFWLPVQGSPGGNNTNSFWDGGELYGLTGSRTCNGPNGSTSSNGNADSQPMWMGALTNDTSNFFGNGSIVNAHIRHVKFGPSHVDASVVCGTSPDPLHLDRLRIDGHIVTMILEDNIFADGGNENTGTLFFSSFLGAVPGVDLRNNYIGGGGTAVIQNNTGGSCPWTFEYNTLTGEPAWTVCTSGMTFRGNVLLNLGGSSCNGTHIKNVFTGALASCGTDFKTTSIGLGVFDSDSATLVPSIGSPVIDKGESGSCPTSNAEDLQGNSRPFSAACDAGAIEFGSSSTPVIIPDNTTRGVTVGTGWIEATNHHVVRTSGDVVYIVAADDSPCLVSGSGVIRVYKGSGSQPLNSLVPTSFSEQDSAHHPVSPGSGQCQFTGGTGNLLFAPDVRLDSSGLIHIAYIDPAATNNGTVYYQTFSTSTNLWGSRTQVATGAETTVGGGWPRGSHCALTLDSAGVPYIAWATGGTSNAIQWSAKTASGGTAFTSPATISGSSGTNEFQTSMVTAIDGSIHLAWIDNALATHSAIKYAKFSSGSWSAVETVSSGDANVLGDADHDQMPAVVTDASSRPFVLYNDGVASASDNYIRQRYRTSANTWVDDTAPGGAGGASNSAGTWFNHTSQNYISAVGDVYIFLGHDVDISPGPFSYQLGGPGNNWSAVTQLDPCDTTTETAGEAGCDGSMSIRFDPVRPGRTNLIDLVYYDEDDGSVAGNHHGTIYYKAVGIAAPTGSSNSVQTLLLLGK